MTGSRSKRVALECAWALTITASTFAPVVVGLIGIAFAAVVWCLAASVLAVVTGRLLNEHGWYDAAVWVTIGTLFFWADQIALTTAGPGALAWVLYLVVVPTRLFVRSQRSLRPASTKRTGWRSPAASALAIRSMTLLSGAVMVWRAIRTDVESESIGAAADVAGCYHVVVSPWLGSRFGEGMSAVIPNIIQLDTVRGPAPASDSSRPTDSDRHPFERGNRLIRPGWNGAAIWSVSSGTLHLAWTTGFHGAATDMMRVGSHFLGQIDEFTDEIPSFLPSALIWLRPTGCDAPNAQGEFRARDG